jgi:uroporphyrinogen III methyltransferase/synthase
MVELFEGAGAEVEQVVAYRTRRVAELPGEVVEALERGEVDWATFTSGSTVRNLVDLLGDRRGLLDGMKVAAIGPMTAAAARGAGLKVDAEAVVPGVGGVPGG